MLLLADAGEAAPAGLALFLSELVLCCELDDARVAHRRRDLAEGGTRCCRKQWISISKSGIGVRELRRICQIEKFCPEPEGALFLYREYPFDRHVKVVLPRSAHDADSAIAKVLIRCPRAVWRLGCLHERVGIQITASSSYPGEQ